MATILDKYGIKEVADVTFYDILPSGLPGAPVLFLDTLKVSTLEQTAEQAEAKGGKGAPPLIIWDYGKEINVTLEDALFSPKSMAVMFGNGTVASKETGTLMKTIQFTATAAETIPSKWQDANGFEQPVPDTSTIYTITGETIQKTAVTAGTIYFLKFEAPVIDMSTIEINAANFPGTYYVTGETYARSAITGKDDYFQFIIPKAKMQPENTITLEAEGDPSVFNMSIRVLRPQDGAMMKLVKYGFEEIGG